jgi:hypothetical protein
MNKGVHGCRSLKESMPQTVLQSVPELVCSAGAAGSNLIEPHFHRGAHKEPKSKCKAEDALSCHAPFLCFDCSRARQIAAILPLTADPLQGETWFSKRLDGGSAVAFAKDKHLNGFTSSFHDRAAGLSNSAPGKYQGNVWRDRPDFFDVKVQRVSRRWVSNALW